MGLSGAYGPMASEEERFKVLTHVTSIHSLSDDWPYRRSLMLRTGKDVVSGIQRIYMAIVKTLSENGATLTTPLARTSPYLY